MSPTLQIFKNDLSFIDEQMILLSFFDNFELKSLKEYKKKPTRMFIWMQKFVQFYLPHYEIPQPSSAIKSEDISKIMPRKQSLSRKKS